MRPSTTGKKGGVIRFRTSLHNTIFDVMQNRGWKEVDGDGDGWDFNWADVGWIRDKMDQLHMDADQRINHFRNHYELTRKDLLVKNLKRKKKELEREDNHAAAAKYDFCPLSYTLPSEYAIFADAFKQHPGAVWIMKPIGKAQGKGIFLFSKIKQIDDWKKDHTFKADTANTAEAYICQKYIDRPLTVGGKKFDMRIYALVTCYSPLCVWMYRDGFCRFSATRYSMDRKSDMSNPMMHLTNVAIQKGSDNYSEGTGCKWLLQGWRMHLLTKYGQEAVNAMFREIELLVINSLLAVQKVMINDKHCFELYGYDVMCDDALKPWLLEVNASPSLTADTKEDYSLKYALLDDMLHVLDLEKHLTGTEEQVGGFDLLYSPKLFPQTQGHPDRAVNPNLSLTSSRLGTSTGGRLKQLSKLFKQTAKQATLAAAAGGTASGTTSGASSRR